MKKLMKVWQNKFLKNYVILSLAFLILEIFFRAIEDLSIISYSGLRIFLGINILALIFSFILQFLPNLVAKIFNPLITLGLTIYGIAELGFNHFLGVYASIQVKSQASAVSNYVIDFIKSFNWTFYLLFIPFILMLTYYIFFDKKLSIDLPKKKITALRATIKCFYFLIIVILIFAYYGTMRLKFMQNSLQKTSAYEIFLKPTTPSLVVNEFGYIGFGILDIKEYLFPGKELDTEILYDPDSINNPIKNPIGSEGHEVTYSSVTNINNDIWKNIIASENDKNKNTLNKYFIGNNVSMTNEFTGMFNNKNFIAIMIESGSNIILNYPEYYPYMAKLYAGGWTWDNYYSPRNSCSTGNNELSGMTSLYTIYNNCTSNIYKDNKYYESIFNLFNNKGYETNSFHNHFDAYYYRTTIHKNMGSGHFYKVQDMKIPYGHQYGDWASDDLMMKYYLSVLDKRDTTKPFMSWITTVTSHQPYNISRIFSDEYFDLFDKSLPADVRSYMSRLKIVDNAIGTLINGLEERGLLDDTVIALYADHYPYAISTSNLNKVFDKDLSIDNNADQVPFIIYNKNMTPKHFMEYTSYIDFTPTIGNLFGLDYDSRLYMGSDILSKDYESLVLFADGSWKNEYAYFNAGTNKIKYYTDKVYSDEEILAINEKLSLKLKMSSLAIRTDYFSYLDKKLSSYSTSTE